MSDAEHPFREGVEVAVVTRPRWGGVVEARKTRVEKVYRNGRFVLAGSKQQYRALNGYFDRKWTAAPTGDNIYYSTVELLTPELLEEIRASQRARRVEVVIGKLHDNRRLAHQHVTDDELSLMESIIDKLTQASGRGEKQTA